MPSSSNALSGLQPLSRDPLTTIQGDLGLLVRQLLTPEERKLPMSQQKQLVVQRQGEMGKIKDLADLGQKGFENQKNILDQTQSSMPGSADTTQFSFAQKTFNLRRYAQIQDPMGGMPSATEPTPVSDPSQSQPPQFEDASDLREFLIQSGPESASRMFTDLVSNNPEAEQTVSDALSRFFESNEPQRTLEMATVIFNMLPQSVKSSPDPNLGDTQVSAIEHTVAESNEAIRLAAIAAVKAKASAPIKQAFNMKLFKTAQHKGLENVMMFGPNQVRIDPATGYMISNWHTTERNKGWGIKMPDAMDVDFETLWRQNIMDKYSRPYRNEDGVEVGGYLNKRFETDRSVPAGNTYQLLPGQKRRAYLPEYRGYEARLQAMRSEKNDRGLEFVNTDKPMDWAKEGTTFAPFNFKRSKEAKFASKKKSNSLTKKADFFDIVTADLKPLQPLMKDPGGQVKEGLPGQEKLQGGGVCKQCHAQLSGNPTPITCPSCGAPTSQNTQWSYKTDPSQQQNRNLVIPTGPLSRVAQNAMEPSNYVTMPSNHKIVAPPTNPVMERRVHPLPPRTPQINREESVEISDPHADKAHDPNHMNAVHSSASALGL